MCDILKEIRKRGMGMKNGDNERPKFYQRAWFTILMLIVFFPVGLYLMWKHNKFPFAVRVIISAFFGLMVVSSIFDYSSNEDLYNKIRELEEKNEQLEMENEELEKKYAELEKYKESENEIESKNDIEPDHTSTEESEEVFSENIEQPSETQTEEIESLENIVLNNLKKALGDKVGDEAYDILINQIGFTNLEYIENTAGTGNHTMSSSECNFILTAFPDDKVYRIFQPNGGAVFYEDDTVKMTVGELKDRAINYNDMSAYYIMAKSIVESGLKSPRSSKFPSIVTRPEEIAMSKNGDIIAVQSYVDAENSFGAMIRSKWTVQFEVIDISTYSYNPLYVNIDGETLYGEWVGME